MKCQSQLPKMCCCCDNECILFSVTAVHENQQLVLKSMNKYKYIISIHYFCGIVYNVTSDPVFAKCFTVKNRKVLSIVSFKNFLQAFAKVHLEWNLFCNCFHN